MKYVKFLFLFFQESRKFDQGLVQLQQLALPKLQLERLPRRLRRSKRRKNYQNDTRFWGKQTICRLYNNHTKLNFEEANFSLFVYCSYKTRFWGKQNYLLFVYYSYKTRFWGKLTRCFWFCVTIKTKLDLRLTNHSLFLYCLYKTGFLV